MWTAEVTKKYRDTSNFNIVAEITYKDETGKVVGVDKFGGVDLTDAAVAEQARKRIRNVFEVGDVALAALTIGPVTLPAEPVPDPKAQAVITASRALQVAARDAEIAALKSPTADAALADLKAAEAALADKG